MTRRLTVHLSDGTRKIRVKEYRYIDCLNKDILPGTKVHLVGTINYEHKTLSISDENIKIIGGIVSEIGTPEYLSKLTEQAL